ncbi:hypothetical protein CR513_51477, partial [Mucuna pruriens]
MCEKFLLPFSDNLKPAKQLPTMLNPTTSTHVYFSEKTPALYFLDDCASRIHMKLKTLKVGSRRKRRRIQCSNKFEEKRGKNRKGEEEIAWSDAIINYPNTNKVLDDPQEARRIKREAAEYVLVVGLLYKQDAMIPVKVEESLPRVSLIQSDKNEVELRTNLDLLQEERGMAYIRECVAKARVARNYNVIVFPRPIRKDDLVLRRTLVGAVTNKLMPNWEGPFRV